jgi:hypothetical protein
MSDRPGEYRYVRGRHVDPKTGRPTGDEEIPVAEALEAQAGFEAEPELELEPECEEEPARSPSPPAAPKRPPPPLRASTHLAGTRPRASTQRILWVGSGAVAAMVGMVVLGMQAPRSSTAPRAALVAEVESASVPSAEPVARSEVQKAGAQEVEEPAPIQFVRATQPPEPSPERVQSAPSAQSEGAFALPAAIAPEPAPEPPPIAVPTVAIAINATPWATIEIDGEPVGETPLSGVSLPVGRHRFVAHMPDGSVRERVTHIDSDSDAVLFE